MQSSPTLSLFQRLCLSCWIGSSRNQHPAPKSDFLPGLCPPCRQPGLCRADLSQSLMKCSKRDPRRDLMRSPCLLAPLAELQIGTSSAFCALRPLQLCPWGSAAASAAPQPCWKLSLGLVWLGSCQITSPAPALLALTLLLQSLKPALCKYFRMGKIQRLLEKSAGFKAFCYFLSLLRSIILQPLLPSQTEWSDIRPWYFSFLFLYLTVFFFEVKAERKEIGEVRMMISLHHFSPCLFSI